MSDKLTRKKPVLLVGWSQELYSLAMDLGYKVAAVVDKNIEFANINVPLVQCDKIAIKDYPEGHAIIGIDDIQVRQNLYHLYKDSGFQILSLLGGTFDCTSKYGHGFVAQTGSILSSNCTIGCSVKLNTGSIVTHDVKIGSFSNIAPGAVVLGRVSIGKSVYVGANSTILPDLDIGEGAFIGAGAVVTKNVKAGLTVIGVPAKPVIF